MSSPTDAAISVEELTKRYGPQLAVDHVTLRVEEGELFGLLGPNGAGKTTLVRLLTALVPMTSGRAWVAGIDVAAHPDAVRRAIGVVPQALTSDLDLTADENLDIFARFFEVPRNIRRPRIDELLHRVGLWDRRHSLVKTFSGGMRRRLEIARGLIHRPKVLFLDEPTIGLDPQTRRVIWDLLRQLRQGGGLTISLTTHYLDEAEMLCDRVAIIDRGHIVALGTPTELKALVPGSDTLELELSRSPELVQLAKLPDVRAVEQTATGVRLRTDRGAQVLPRVFDEVERQGIEVRSANLTQITLEDVFINITGRTLREGGAEPPQASLPRRYT
jgi:ABC-2 type transport system ATP-binding protein